MKVIKLSINKFIKGTKYKHSINRNNKEIDQTFIDSKKIINEVVNRCNLITDDLYMFLRAYILYQFETTNNIPIINANLLRCILNVITYNSSKAGPKIRINIDLINNLTLFYNKYIESTHKKKNINNLSHIFGYKITDIITNIHNNIWMHFEKHIKNFIKFVYKTNNIEYTKQCISTTYNILNLGKLPNPKNTNYEYINKIINKIKKNILPQNIIITEDKPLMYYVKSNPIDFMLSLIKMNNIIEKYNNNDIKKENIHKLYQWLPRKASYIPEYIAIDTCIIQDIFDTGIYLRSEKTKEDINKLWIKYFKYLGDKKSRLKSKNYVFNDFIYTDGVAVSILYNTIEDEKNKQKIINARKSAIYEKSKKCEKIRQSIINNKKIMNKIERDLKLHIKLHIKKKDKIEKSEINKIKNKMISDKVKNEYDKYILEKNKIEKIQKEKNIKIRKKETKLKNDKMKEEALKEATMEVDNIIKNLIDDDKTVLTKKQKEAKIKKRTIEILKDKKEEIKNNKFNINENKVKYITEYTKEEIEKLKELTIIGVDPGKNQLVTMIDGSHNKYNYSSQRRAVECKFKQKNKLFKKLKTKEVAKIEEEFSKINYKTTLLKISLEIIKMKFKYQTILSEHYKNKIYRKFKFYTYINTQKSDDKMVKEIKEKYKENICLAYGDWSSGSNQMKNYIPTKRIGLRRMLEKNFKVVLVDEYLTSKTCNACKEETYHPIKHKNPRPKKEGLIEVHTLLRCKNNNCNKYWDRDTNASLNIREIVVNHINGKERPLQLRRGYKREETTDPLNGGNSEIK